MKCEDCKKRIEESKPKFLKSFIGYPLLIIVLSFIVVILLIVLGGGNELFSLGERLILLTIVGSLSFAFFFLPIGMNDVGNNYSLQYMKKYPRIKHLGKITFLPYLFAVLYFGITLISTGDLIYKWLLQTATILFNVLWFIPFIIYIKDVKLNKYLKKR